MINKPKQAQLNAFYYYPFLFFFGVLLLAMSSLLGLVLMGLSLVGIALTTQQLKHEGQPALVVTLRERAVFDDSEEDEDPQTPLVITPVAIHSYMFGLEILVDIVLVLVGLWFFNAMAHVVTTSFVVCGVGMLAVVMMSSWNRMGTVVLSPLLGLVGWNVFDVHGVFLLDKGTKEDIATELKNGMKVSPVGFSMYDNKIVMMRTLETT
jgi:hypothetical protein